MIATCATFNVSQRDQMDPDVTMLKHGLPEMDVVKQVFIFRPTDHNISRPGEIDFAASFWTSPSEWVDMICTHWPDLQEAQWVLWPVDAVNYPELGLPTRHDCLVMVLTSSRDVGMDQCVALVQTRCTSCNENMAVLTKTTSLKAVVMEKYVNVQQLQQAVGVTKPDLLLPSFLNGEPMKPWCFPSECFDGDYFQERYGKHISNDGTFLGLVDIAMLADKWNKNVVMLYYDNDFQGHHNLRLLRNIFNELLGFPQEPMPPLDSPDTWVIAVCRGDFSRDGFLSLNHYLPVWTRQQLGEVWEEAISPVQKKFEKRIATTIKRLEIENDDSGSGSGDEARKASLKEQLESLERKKTFLDLLIQMDMFPMDDLGEMWMQSSKDVAWQVASKTMEMDKYLPNDDVSQPCKKSGGSPEAGSPGASTNHPSTPKKNSKKEVLNQSKVTPEKEKNQNVKGKGNGARPVNFGQPKQKETVLMAAGKRPPLDTPEVEPPARSGKKMRQNESKKGETKTYDIELDPLDLVEEEKDSHPSCRVPMRLATTKKANMCTDGGFVKLQNKLLLDKPIGCHSCQALLTDCKFDADEFHDFVLKWMSGDMKSTIGDHAAEILSKVEPPKVEKPQAEEGDGSGSEDDQPEDRREAAMAYLKTVEPMITLLESGQFGKTCPVRCNLCRSTKWPEGKVIECNTLRAGSLRHFIGQHFKSRQHLDALQDKTETPQKMVPCRGLCVNDPGSAKLWMHRSEFKIWASLANFHGCAKHTYWFDANEDSWWIRSFHCLKDCVGDEESERNACVKCRQLGQSHGVIRAPIRFIRKYYAAQLLTARLFDGDQGVSDVLHSIRKSPLWESGDVKLRELVELDCGKLQYWVRTSWLHDGSMNKQLENYVASCVRPAVKCSIASVPKNMHVITAKFEAIIRGGLASEEDMASLKVACAAAKGELASHPLVLGLALQCHRLVEKESRGITHMQGRRSRETPHEAALIADAGLSLAIAGANMNLARQFGVPASALKIDVDELVKLSLPQPALALCFPEIMKENFALADQRFVRERGRLVVAFDSTYLTATLSQMTLHTKRGLVGGTWKPEAMDQAFVSLEGEDLDIGTISKSANMLEFLTWDPTSRTKCTVPLLTLPVEHSFQGTNAGMRGNWYMLETVGRFMAANQGVVKALIHDAHGSHNLVRQVLHGQVDDIPDKDLKNVPFFGELTFEPLPQHCLPRLPIMLAKHQGEYVYDIPGHANKNSGAQATSWIRTVYYGSYWLDMTMARAHGLPPGVLARDSPMSDKYQAMMSNPFYYVKSVDA
eukprot:s3829_g5.t1